MGERSLQMVFTWTVEQYGSRCNIHGVTSHSLEHRETKSEFSNPSNSQKSISRSTDIYSAKQFPPQNPQIYNAFCQKRHRSFAAGSLSYLTWERARSSTWELGPYSLNLGTPVMFAAEGTPVSTKLVIQSCRMMAVVVLSSSAAVLTPSLL